MNMYFIIKFTETMLAELFTKTLLDRRINHMSLSGSLVEPKYPLSRYKAI